MPLLQKGYLGSTPLFRNIPFFAGPQVTASNSNTATITVTASASTNTKGAWAQAIASTTTETTLLAFFVSGIATSAQNSATLIDIGVGAAGSETVVIPNIAVGSATALNIMVPVKIASGSRISIRSQSAVASKSFTIATRNFAAFNAGDSALTPTTLDVLGTSTATSTGTAMSGASATWVEIVASTSQNYSAFSIVPSVSDTDIAAIEPLVYEIGVGSAGSEISFGRIILSTANTESVSMRPVGPLIFGREVPSGSRLSIRHNITANPGKYDACIIAVPKV